MRFDWRNHGLSKDPCPVGRVVDLDTGKPISGPEGLCCFVDEEAGEWRRYKFSNGKAVIGKDGRIEVESGKARVKFFPWSGPAVEFEAFLLNYIRQHEGV